jgi:curved DNA-binding protein CbpA
MDPYEILGISEAASDKEIKQRYLELIKQVK